MKAIVQKGFPALVSFFLLAASLSGQPRPITEKDLLKFQWVARPQISPDGRQVAYVLVTVNEKEDRYDTSIWSVATSGASAPRRLTAGPRDSSPRWSPDGRTLAFLRVASEKEKPQIYLLPMDGGEARQLTDLPRGASAAAWSPSGKTIAFTSSTTAADLEEQRRAREKKGTEEKKKSDVHVVTRAVFREDGEGWLDPMHPDHIWTVEASPGADGPAQARPITSGRFDERDPVWNPDGSRIYFISDPVDEPYYLPPDSNLYTVRAEGGPVETVIDINGPVNAAVPAPDGSRFAFAGFVNPPQMRSHTRADVFLWAGAKATALTAGQEFELGSDVIGDQHPPRGGGETPLAWTRDGRSLLLVTTLRGRSNLVRLDVATRRIEPLTQGDNDVFSCSWTPDASKAALAMADATHIGDVYVLDARTRKLTQLTHVNEALFSQLALSRPEEFWYTSFDGQKINGWILKPPGFDPAKRYPLILEIHGGPHTAYGHTFFHEFQWMAAKGYVVLYTNPRGSTTYGQEFANVIQYRYPGDDYKDLMAGVDEVLRRGYVDEKRMGVTGGSGGGLLTNWTVTQTDRFAAAVSQRSVGDWSGFWYTADFALFMPFWFHSTPFHDPEEFLARSPVRYAEKIHTPLMLTVGERDERAPPGQGAEAMFRALKAQKKPTALVSFPGETHELSRSGKPSHRIERLEHIVNWFEKYLKGEKTDAYDLYPSQQQ
ncbi:MAG TPA: S9 family peptidase [Thermoanaerobaculia bacterium]|nr:S9 family peptidase [Thermoanaerobaculia bacterium]